MQAVTHPLLSWFLVTLIVQSKFHQYMLRLYSTNQQAKCALLLTSFHCQESFLLSGHWSYTEPTHNSFGQVEHDAKAKIIVTYYIYIYTSSIVGLALLKVAQNLYCNLAFSCPMKMITGTACIIETLQIAIKVLISACLNIELV